MLRTRDFVLVLTVVVFLVMAIGVTVFSQGQKDGGQRAGLQPAAVKGGEYSAVTVGSHEFSRTELLQQMRDKIAASSQLSITAPEPVAVIVEATTSTSTTASADPISGLQLCPSYAVARVNWSPAGIQIEEVEGARLVYKMREALPVVTQNAGATTSPVLLPPQRQVLAQLPVRTVPAASPVCIPFDVIGIANDGSLIRNNEARIYGIFNSSTLVGYALDGFPIYGSSAEVSDTCGGVMKVEGYRYQISPQRETILNCYSAPPVRL